MQERKKEVVDVRFCEELRRTLSQGRKYVISQKEPLGDSSSLGIGKAKFNFEHGGGSTVFYEAATGGANVRKIDWGIKRFCSVNPAEGLGGEKAEIVAYFSFWKKGIAEARPTERGGIRNY